MPPLRLREFWSLELDHLFGLNLKRESGDYDLGGASYVADWATFEAIGDGHLSVLVCASIKGVVCIIQVPNAFQMECQQEDSNNKLIGADNENQVLSANEFSFPIIDLKCGYFTSTLKQSISVLSFDKLVVYQVKKRKLDLISSTSFEENKIDPTLFTHELEEQFRVDLLADEIPAHLSLMSNSFRGYLSESKENPGSNTKLPQRDQLIVTYTNQFLLTVTDFKKVAGHFEIMSKVSLGTDPNSNERRVESQSKLMGPATIAYLYEPNSGSKLAIGLSDQCVYCIPVDIMLAKAKQSVVKQAARNLLLDDNSGDRKNPRVQKIKEKQASSSSVVEIDLESLAIWHHEFPRAFVEMHSTHRRSSSNDIDSIQEAQLMVMSRYTIDLFSSSGEIIWSHRSEEPLICSYQYTLRGRNDTSEVDSRSPVDGKLLTLVCSDRFSGDSCNFSIFEDNRLVWAAILDARPMKIWRVNLAKSRDVIALLDSKQDKVAVGYLTTNTNTPLDAVEDHSGNDQLARLIYLDDGLSSEGKATTESFDGNESRRAIDSLNIDVKLEASNQWPDVLVDCSIRIKTYGPECYNDISSSELEVYHNLVAVLEFDELFSYRSIDRQAAVISAGAIQLSLGSFWPDRNEPLVLRGQFTFKGKDAIGQIGKHQMDLIDDSNQMLEGIQLDDTKVTTLMRDLMLPNSLLIRLYLRFNDTKLVARFQEHSFQLPLSIVSQLCHIDYSHGQGQCLADIFCNIHPYERTLAEFIPEIATNQSSDISASHEGLYFSDIVVSLDSQIIDIIDELIESDLVCRGLNAECSDFSAYSRSQRRFSTHENLNLLAQSLNCRLKFRANPNRSNNASAEIIEPESQEAGEYEPPVMVSIALRMPSGLSPAVRSIQSELGRGYTKSISAEVLLWLHIVDLNATESVIPEQLVRHHQRNWKMFSNIHDDYGKIINETETQGGNRLLISIECEQPAPVLLVHSHLMLRMRRRYKSTKHLHLPPLMPLLEEMNDAIDIEFTSLLKMGNFIAFSLNMNDFLVSLIDNRNTKLVEAFEKLKRRLTREFQKYRAAVDASISMCKQLSNLPESDFQQFEDLNDLSKKYQTNLAHIIKELETLSAHDYYISKIPTSSDISLQLTKEDSHLFRLPESFGLVIQ